MNNYVVATIKEWNTFQYNNRVKEYAGNWFLVDHKKDLTMEFLRKVQPKYIFFPHWSWLVPEEILTEFTCICFHMTDVPYGRGGSPLQNLIIRGHKKTMLTSLKMVKELDAGPVYLKKELSLVGSATEIFTRSSELTFEMIESIVLNDPAPVRQEGEITEFKRRKPEDGELLETMDVECIYNTIRMLDAETYPSAHLNLGNLKLEFTAVSKYGTSLQATVKIFEKKTKND
jgi:methionyl-tRNA formyltransferase